MMKSVRKAVVEEAYSGNISDFHEASLSKVLTRSRRP